MKESGSVTAGYLWNLVVRMLELCGLSRGGGMGALGVGCYSPLEIKALMLIFALFILDN